jgi:hypothetical protein
MLRCGNLILNAVLLCLFLPHLHALGASGVLSDCIVDVVSVGHIRAKKENRGVRKSQPP